MAAFGHCADTLTTSYLHDLRNPAIVNGSLILAAFGMDTFYAQISGSTVQSQLIDALGSTIALADAAGVITASYSYTPYGVASKTGTADTFFQFTRREQDGAAGLQFNRFRYYKPDLGRFISEDPVGLLGGLNRYAYARGNPLRFVDPLGLQDQDASPDASVTDPLGIGPQGQEACDLEDDRKEAEREAADARARGEWAEYRRLRERAERYTRKYYEKLDKLNNVKAATTSGETQEEHEAEYKRLVEGNSVPDTNEAESAKAPEPGEVPQPTDTGQSAAPTSNDGQ